MTQVVMNKQKTIALIAHDHQKEDLVEWCVRNQERTQETFLMRNWNNIEDDRRGNRPSGKAVQEWDRLAVISRSAQGSQKVRSI